MLISRRKSPEQGGNYEKAATGALALPMVAVTAPRAKYLHPRTASFAETWHMYVKSIMLTTSEISTHNFKQMRGNGHDTARSQKHSGARWWPRILRRSYALSRRQTSHAHCQSYFINTTQIPTGKTHSNARTQRKPPNGGRDQCADPHARLPHAFPRIFHADKLAHIHIYHTQR